MSLSCAITNERLQEMRKDGELWANNCPRHVLALVAEVQRIREAAALIEGTLAMEMEAHRRTIAERDAALQRAEQADAALLEVAYTTGFYVSAEGHNDEPAPTEVIVFGIKETERQLREAEAALAQAQADVACLKSTLRSDEDQLKRVVDQNAALRDALIAEHERSTLAEAPEMKFRGQLWLNHGCPVAVLYGDDGEMQCNNPIHRPLNFKTAELLSLVDSLRPAAPPPALPPLPSSTRVHVLKTDPVVFGALALGAKTYEIRKDDRGFALGDGLDLRETESSGAQMAAGAPLVYTGRRVLTTVTHILRGPAYGLADGWVVLSMRHAEAAHRKLKEKEEPDGM